MLGLLICSTLAAPVSPELKAITDLCAANNLPPPTWSAEEGCFANTYDQLAFQCEEGKLNHLVIAQIQSPVIPDSITNLSELEVLYLSELGLKEIPSAVFGLPSLGQLNLAYNQIEAIPESIGQLSKMSTLLLRNNQLRSLPRSITNLKDLEIFNLDENRLPPTPEQWLDDFASQGHGMEYGTQIQ